MGHRQAEPGALADALGGEEGLDRALARGVVHAQAGVGHRHDDVVAVREPVDRAVLAGRTVVHAEREHAALGHRVAGVDAEVEDGHLELVGIGDRRPQATVDLDAHLHPRAAGTVDQLGHSGDQRTHVHVHRLQGLAAREREQAVHQHGGAVRRPPRDGDHARAAVLARGRVAGEIQCGHDRREEVVEVVGDAAGQLAHRLELLRLAQRGLGIAALGGVDGLRHDRDDAARRVADRADRQIVTAASRRQRHGDLVTRRLACCGAQKQAAHVLRHPRRAAEPRRGPQGAAHHIVHLHAQRLEHGAVGVGERAVERAHGLQLVTGFEQHPQLGLGPGQCIGRGLDVGHVAGAAVDASPFWRRHPGQRAQAAAAGAPAVFETAHRTPLAQRAEHLAGDRLVLFADVRPPAVSVQFVGVPAQQLCPRRVDRLDRSLEVHHGQQIRRDLPGQRAVARALDHLAFEIAVDGLQFGLARAKREIGQAPRGDVHALYEGPGHARAVDDWLVDEIQIPLHRGLPGLGLDHEAGPFGRIRTPVTEHPVEQFQIPLGDGLGQGLGDRPTDHVAMVADQALVGRIDVLEHVVGAVEHRHEARRLLEHAAQLLDVGAQAPLVLHLAGDVGGDVEEAADRAGFIADRSVGERPVRLFRIAVAQHRQRHVLAPGRGAGHRAVDPRPDVGPDIRPDRLQRLAERTRLLAAEHRRVGVVVEQREFRPPAQAHREARIQHQAQGRTQRLGPVLDGAERRGRPVEHGDFARHRATRRQEIEGAGGGGGHGQELPGGTSGRGILPQGPVVE